LPCGRRTTSGKKVGHSVFVNNARHDSKGLFPPTLVDFQAGIKEAITKYLYARLESQYKARRYEVLCQLLGEIRTCGNSKLEDASERPPFLFPWNSSADFLQDVVGTLLERIVNLAINDEDTSIRRVAHEFLKQLGQNGEIKSISTLLICGLREPESLSNSLKINALAWLRYATKQDQPNLGWARENSILVLEMFERQCRCSEFDMLLVRAAILIVGSGLRLSYTQQAS
jgi:hypothetical protein